ncbi:class I SAM-dependent methyltransferase [bacterium]|nr:class I SAM-dependent methyltransferase [bacterium]
MGRLLAAPMVLAGRIRRALRSAYDDAVLAKYTSLHSIHYGPGGRGYASAKDVRGAEAKQIYATLVSRVEYFVDTFPDLLDYQDGDSFVDIGCGMGQNIRMLSQRFPNSPITGIDISADAVEIVQTAEPNPRVSTQVGDVLDPQMLNGLLASRPDHIVVSHVFALLFAPTAEETRRLRFELAEQLAGSCRKSLIILDQFGRRGQLEVSIEQLNRAVIHDDVLEYFASISSVRAVLANSPRSQAVICQRLAAFEE